MSEKTIAFSVLVISVGVAAVGQVCFKVGATYRSFNSISDIPAQLTNWPLMLGFLAYFGSALLYIYALRTIPLSIAYPTLAIGYVAVVLASVFFLGENMTIGQGAGILLICAGVVLLWS